MKNASPEPRGPHIVMSVAPKGLSVQTHCESHAKSADCGDLIGPQGQNRNNRENEMAKVAIVTGAGTGVGRAAALALMKAGYSVALAGRRKEPLEAVFKEGGGNGIAGPTGGKETAAIGKAFLSLKE